MSIEALQNCLGCLECPRGPQGPPGPPGSQPPISDSITSPDSGVSASSKAVYDLHQKISTMELFVRGMIMLWTGTEETIPHTWALCNGENGTPDLRGRFIMGAGGTTPFGAVGGTAIPTTTANGQHTHAQGNTGWSGDHIHTAQASGAATLSVEQMPSHGHSVSGVNGAKGGIIGDGDGWSNRNFAITGYSTGGSGAGWAHSHPGGNTDTSGGHAHTPGSIAANGSHTHTVNVIPPYYALAYIMKL